MEANRDVVDFSMEATNWAALPKELLEGILSQLYGKDVRLFHLVVCRRWHTAEEFVFQKGHNPLIFPELHSQWLFHKQSSDLTYQFIHPVYLNVRYSKNLLEGAEKVSDAGAIVRHSKDGWLLMSSGKCSMFFFSPFPEKVIELPDLIWPHELDGVTFTCAPTSSTGCCVVFVISCLERTHVEIATIRLGKKKWKTNQYENNILFRPSYSNPVFLKEKFYCSSTEGKLGEYNHKEDTWTVFEKPLHQRKWAHENYLVEHEGGLMSLFIGDSGSWISVFKLKESDMVWESVYSLGEYALFVSAPTSFATKSVLAMMKNKIFFPMLHNNYPVFYSLRTKTFGTYGSNLCESNLHQRDVGRQLESCWIEPREICYQEEELDWLLETNDEETDDDEADEYETDDVLDEWSEDETDEGETREDDRTNNGEEYKTSDESQEEAEAE